MRVANATFLIGGEMVDVFGRRAEQLAHRLAIAEWRGAADLADRIGAHVADGERKEAELELDEHEQRALLTATAELVAAASSPRADLVALRDVLARAVGS